MSEQNKIILRMPEVIGKVGLKKSSIYQLIKEGAFPKPIRLTSSAVGWYKHELDEWLDSRERGLTGEFA